MRTAGGALRIGLCLALLALGACGIKGDPEAPAEAVRSMPGG